MNVVYIPDRDLLRIYDGVRKLSYRQLWLLRVLRIMAFY